MTTLDAILTASDRAIAPDAIAVELTASELVALTKAHLLDPANRPWKDPHFGNTYHPLGMRDFSLYAVLRGKPWFTGVDTTKTIDRDSLGQQMQYLLRDLATKRVLEKEAVPLPSEKRLENRLYLQAVEKHVAAQLGIQTLIDRAMQAHP